MAIALSIFFGIYLAFIYHFILYRIEYNRIELKQNHHAKDIEAN